MLEVVLACLITGVVVGWLAGLLGIGGGVIIVPVLSYLLMTYMDAPLSQAMPMAIATSLSTIIFTGFSSARAHFKLGNIAGPIVVYCGAGVAMGAILGAQVASRVDGEKLTVIFSGLLLLIAANMLIGKIKTREHTPERTALVGVGTGAGVLSALMGIGGGAVLVPALCWFGVALRTAIGCAAAGGLIVAVFGTLSFIVAGLDLSSSVSHTVGYVFLPATISISATSIIFAPLGAKFGQRIDTTSLKKFFACFLVVVSIRMIWGLS
jgi:uncharacterized membrane protein YfcA